MAIMERTRTDDIDLRVVEPTDGPDALVRILADVPDVVVISVQPGPIHPLQICREVADHAPISRDSRDVRSSVRARAIGAW